MVEVSLLFCVWYARVVPDDTLLLAYLRARDTDPRSSFRDVVAPCRPVDIETARFLRIVMSDAVMVVGFEPGAVAELRAERSGIFLILDSDPTFEPPHASGGRCSTVTVEQDRDTADLDASLPRGATLSFTGPPDALLAVVVLRFTQSDPVAFVRDGATMGVGAGQQSRVDCVRLAGTKTQIWWLRRHRIVNELPVVAAMARQDRLHWQIRFAGWEMMTRRQEVSSPGCSERRCEKATSMSSGVARGSRT